MTTPLSFRRSDLGTTQFETSDEAWSALGSFLTSDIQRSTWHLVDILAVLEDARDGRLQSEPLSGNSWEGEVTRSQLTLQDLTSDDWAGTYSWDQAHDALLAYWDYLSPSSEKKAVDLRQWEHSEKRDHPCRRHLALD